MEIYKMISVGIDVSKDKSTVCIMKPYGEFVRTPYDINHTEEELSQLVKLLSSLDEEVKVIMEATGHYHLPVLTYLKQHNIFVSVVNPLLMKKYSSVSIRKGKTDKIDAFKIADYGINNWYNHKDFQLSEKVYEELNILSRQYNQYVSIRVKCKVQLSNIIDKTMPGINKLLVNSGDNPKKDKLNSFVEKFWHFDNIKMKTEKQFINLYQNWAKKEGYHASETKARSIIYALAQNGIPTLDSNTPSTKMLVLEAVRLLRETEVSVSTILSHMMELAKSLDEYETVRSMNGVGDKLAVRLIAEIGDVRRFYSSKALIAYAGIDAPQYQSGNFYGTKRHISKRGNKSLRKAGYEVMKMLKVVKPEEDNAVYLYILKKELEGKPKKVAKIAGLNKFLRIYYTRVKELYS
jgi:transposase